MSRAKRAKERKAQRKKTDKNKQFIMIGGLLAVVIGIVVLVLIQPSPGQTVVVDGERPAWQNASLTNARTGEVFTLADLDNRNVYVKVMSQF
jgi:preprotein translocase subunit YajC